MTPRETLEAIAGPTGDIGAAFYFHPSTVAAGKEMGLGGFPFYILGRGGALGDVPPEVVSAAFGYFHPGVIASTWEKYSERVSPPDAAQAYWDQCAARGEEFFAEIDTALLEGYVNAAEIVIDHATSQHSHCSPGTHAWCAVTRSQDTRCRRLRSCVSCAAVSISSPCWRAG